MKTFSKVCLFACSVVASVFSFPAQGAEPAIASFSGGYLSWTNSPGGWHMYSVEWTHDLMSGQWKSNWSNQEAVVTTQSMVSVPVPTSYRVAQGFDERALNGPWVVYSPDDLTIMRADGRGLIQMFGAFITANPAGYYQVNSNGLINVFVYSADEVIPFSAVIISPTALRYTYMGSTGLIQRVVNPAALQGTWRGSIGIYTNVIMKVRSDGYAPGISNLIDVASGLLYLDVSNTVAGAIWTGADCNSSWAALGIRAVLLNPTNIFGDYMLDADTGWFTAGVNLKKQ